MQRVNLLGILRLLSQHLTVQVKLSFCSSRMTAGSFRSSSRIKAPAMVRSLLWPRRAALRLRGSLRKRCAITHARTSLR